ncbi:TetR/AcrR family transcriptional regulator [Nocardia flavorosea]|uniref:TetR/AcrR family transcriptional regulator n=1 Tax=Nocardia flavorosea TaxID=53429 RepID=A0A846YCG8_9NOCA|nr:TetR/AcrR family transcriptional regulator [Nocardia flavorosea]NKY55444.1 TetR/AcrR family transcriptional regulator [Nocardia flavorosea]
MPAKPGQRKRPTQERARATREHILDTAARLFGERGIADTSTNRIATAAGVSVGTVYRYFTDRAVMVDELLERLLETVEQQITHHLAGASVDVPEKMMARVLEITTDVLVANAPLVRALVAGVQFYSSGIPEFEPRLRILIKVMLIQMLGPGDDREYDVMSFVLINTGFAAVLRASALDVDDGQRAEAINMTARMIGRWMESEIERRPRP